LEFYPYYPCQIATSSPTQALSKFLKYNRVNEKPLAVDLSVKLYVTFFKDCLVV
jgi:hypothetical protein